MAESNRILYEKRNEPPNLIDMKTGRYVNLRTTEDIQLLRKVIDYIDVNFGKDYVITPWFSPPYGRIVGYGIYTREEDRLLAERCRNERWGFPRFAYFFDKEMLEERILKLGLPHIYEVYG